MMKVSVITVSYNSVATIRDTIESVYRQTYPDIEYIIIDGNSRDGTLDIIKEYEDKITSVVSEPDCGIYDAMNKGIRLATGEIVGILNSDDFFTSNDVISNIVAGFEDGRVDAVYGDVHFVSPENLNRCVRYYSSKSFNRNKMRLGFMPAHPSFYCKRICFDRYGGYVDDYKIAADFELLLRFIYLHKIKVKYIPMDFVTMRTGGISTASFASRCRIMREHLKVFREHGIYNNLFILSLRYFYKLWEIAKSSVD